MWARAPEAPVAELPGAADPTEAQTEPRTRPSQSRPPPGGSIFAPAQPLRGDDDRFRPPPPPVSRRKAGQPARCGRSRPQRPAPRPPESECACATSGPQGAEPRLQRSACPAHRADSLVGALLPRRAGTWGVFPGVSKDLRCNHCPQPAVSRHFAFGRAMRFTWRPFPSLFSL